MYADFHQMPCPFLSSSLRIGTFFVLRIWETKTYLKKHSRQAPHTETLAPTTHRDNPSFPTAKGRDPNTLDRHRTPRHAVLLYREVMGGPNHSRQTLHIRIPRPPKPHEGTCTQSQPIRPSKPITSTILGYKTLFVADLPRSSPLSVVGGEEVVALPGTLH